MTTTANTNAMPNSGESIPRESAVSVAIEATKALCDEGIPL